MLKTKMPYTDIYSVLKLNRQVVLVTVGAFLLSTIGGLLFVFKMSTEMLNSSFVVNSDGSVIPLKLVDQKENLEVEALSHLRLFHSYFYGLDDSNYSEHLEKALWLGDATVDNVYRQKKADGIYNRLLQYSLLQRIISIESEVVLDQSPFHFRTHTVFEINRGTTTDRYQLISTGKLIQVDRNFPHNPHGLLITHYFENSLKKINHEIQ